MTTQDAGTGVPVASMLVDDVALDDAAFRARWGVAFFLVEQALAESPFELDGTLPEGLDARGLDGPRPAAEAVVYLVRRRVAAPERPITLGRSAATDVVLNDRSVSKLHAFLEPLEGGALRVQDAGSKNGTYVNGARVPVPPDNRAVLVEPGDVFMVGTVRGRYLDLRNLRAWLGAHPRRPIPVGRTRVERPVTESSGRNVLQAAVEVLDAVRQFRDKGVELRMTGGTKTLTDMERPSLESGDRE